MRLVFFGTPDFAVPSLRALVEEGFDIAAVVTQPDRPQGRSRSKSVPTPVKRAAEQAGLAVLQPERPSDPACIDRLRDLAPQLGVVVAYGHILRPDLLTIPSNGLLNVHASLLPKLRGAAPIEHAILQGFTETGVSIMQLDEGMDTGPVLQRVPTPIAPDETAGELTERLAELGALALVETLALIAAGEARPEPQDDAQATYAPKITREITRIDWSEPAAQVACQVRAFDPKPGAWTTLDGHEIKLFGPREADEWVPGNEPGRVVVTDPALVVETGGGALQFIDVQPAGRQRMAAADWLRGRGAVLGDRFA